LFSFKKGDLSLGIAIVLSVLAPSIVLIQAITSNSPQANLATLGGNTVAERIRPVINLDDLVGSDGGAQMSAGSQAAKTPEALYQAACLACHAAGVANAPILGDTAAWEPKAAQGIDALVQTAITGKGAMPPKGGSSYSEDELRVVIEYMLAEAGLSG
jgi:cytochrome c5